MFGYIKAYKPEMRVKEYEMYKAVYCTICKEAGKKYGFISRFALSYDFTFLMLLYMSLESDSVSVNKGRCVYNPLKRCYYLNKCSGLPEYPLAVSQILLYYKTIDNIDDEGFFKSLFYRFLKLFMRRGYKKAGSQFPIADEIIKDYYKKQKILEQNSEKDIDKAADPTAEMLSKIFEGCVLKDDVTNSRVLNRLGYCMGKWVYYMDAACDLPDDIKHNKYNPLKYDFLAEQNNKSEPNDKSEPNNQSEQNNKSGQCNNAEKDINKYIYNKLQGNLNICISESVKAFEMLEIKKFKNILGNIVYIGLEESGKTILKEKNN